VAIPPAITIASYAVDGVSYIATGKSLTDHAISEVAGEDCVLIRAAILENPCRDHVTPDSELAVELETNYGGEDVSTELAEADLAAGGPRGRPPTYESRKPGAPFGAPGDAPATALAERRAAPTAPVLAQRPAPAAGYVVVGSFRDRGNAERARRAHAASGAAVVPASMRGQAVYRVVAARAAVRPNDARWTIAPCTGGRSAGVSPCLDRAGIALVRGETVRRPGRGVESAAVPPTYASREQGAPDGQISDHSAARPARLGRVSPGG
jgi:hypothetical protein